MSRRYPARRPTRLLVPLAVLWGASGALSPGAAQELPLLTEYPGAGPYQCPTFPPAEAESAEARAQAAQLASTAAQSVILGELDRSLALLDRATELDPASADLAYRRGRVLEDLGMLSQASDEYCRALALAGEGDGARDARERLDAIAATELTAVPEAARTAVRDGLDAASRGAFAEALAAFDRAVREAPDWPVAVYNRGVVLDRLGRASEAAQVLLRYLDLEPDAPDAVTVSRRVGQLQSMRLQGPSPGAALTLGVLVPGMGHFYSGRPLGGIIVLAAAGGAVIAGFMIKEMDVRCLTDVEPGRSCPSGQVVSREVRRPYLTPSLGAAAAIGLVGAIEAFVHARGRRSQAESGSASTSMDTGLVLGPSVAWEAGALRIRVLGLSLP